MDGRRTSNWWTVWGVLILAWAAFPLLWMQFPLDVLPSRPPGFPGVDIREPDTFRTTGDSSRSSRSNPSRWRRAS